VNVRDDYTLDNAILIVEGTLNMTYRFIFFPLADYASLNFTGTNSGLIVEGGGAVLDVALLDANALFIEIDDVIAWSGDDCSSACGLIDGTFSPLSTTSFPLGLSNPLPVEMISFDAAFESDQVSLNWATASELNNSHFVVQRSLDSKNYIDLGEVEGSGNSKTRIDYQFTDSNPPATTEGYIYYRIKQVDYDGQFEYFNTSVKNESRIVAEKAEPKIWPIPFEENLSVKLPSGTSQLHYVKIYNLDGALVAQKNADSFLSPDRVDVSGLSTLTNGIYLVEIMSDFGVFRKRVVKR
jgi:hypothetical protein